MNMLKTKNNYIDSKKDLLFAIGYKSKRRYKQTYIRFPRVLYQNKRIKNLYLGNEIFYFIKKFNHLVRTELYIKCIKHYIVNEAHKHDDLDKYIELVF